MLKGLLIFPLSHTSQLRKPAARPGATMWNHQSSQGPRSRPLKDAFLSALYRRTIISPLGLPSFPFTTPARQRHGRLPIQSDGWFLVSGWQLYVEVRANLPTQSLLPSTNTICYPPPHDIAVHSRPVLPSSVFEPVSWIKLTFHVVCHSLDALAI